MTDGTFSVGSSLVGGEDTVGGPPGSFAGEDPGTTPEGDPIVPEEFPETPVEWAFLDRHDFQPITYTYVVGQGTPQYALVNIQNPSLNFDLKGPSQFSFALNQLDPVVSQITELVSDIWVYRENELLLRGRIGPSQDSLSADGGSVSFTALDYRALLTTRRHIYDDDTFFFFDADVAEIMKELIDQSEARTAASYGLTYGIGFPTLGRERSEFEPSPGQGIGAAIDTLQESKERGFDWEVDANLEVNAWIKRGTQTPVRMIDYQGACTSLGRDFVTGEFANAGRVSGGDVPVPEVLETSDLAIDPRGRWEAELNWPDTETQLVMEDRAEYLLEQVDRVPEHFTVDLIQGFWGGKTDLWLGDAVQFAINFGRLGVTEPVRIHGIKISPSPEGKENVSLELK